MRLISTRPYKTNSALSLSMLESIEAKAIEKSEDRTMERIKLGREGWLEEGIEKGIAKGRLEGLEEGIEQGLEQVALRLLEKDISVAEICEITKLSRSKINKLKARKHAKSEKKKA